MTGSTRAYDAGFFAFRNPARDRMMATWLIASEPDNPLLVALHAAFVDFVNRRTFSNQNTAFGRYVVDRLTPILRQDVRRTTLWLNPLVQSLLRAYPYFFFHYLFNRLILTRPDLRALWERVGPIEARPLHTLQNYARAARYACRRAVRTRAQRLAGAEAQLEERPRDAVLERRDARFDGQSAARKSWSQRAARPRVRSLRQTRVSSGGTFGLRASFSITLPEIRPALADLPDER